MYDDDKELTYTLNEMRLRIAILGLGKIKLEDGILPSDQSIKAYVERRANDLHKRLGVGPP